MNATTTTLIQALGSPEGSDRREAALAMGAASDPSVVPALLDRIRVEQNSCVREDLTWAIVQHAETAGPVLLEMVGSDDPGERRTAAHVISKLGDSLHFEAVSRLVADEDPDVAIKAYRAAANTEEPPPSTCWPPASVTGTCTSATRSPTPSTPSATPPFPPSSVRSPAGTPRCASTPPSRSATWARRPPQRSPNSRRLPLTRSPP